KALVASMTILPSSPLTLPSASATELPGTATRTASASEASPPSLPSLVTVCPAFSQRSASPPPTFPRPMVVIFTARQTSQKSPAAQAADEAATGDSPHSGTVPASALFRRRSALDPLELDHQPAQQSVQLLLLRDAQRRCDQLLLARLHTDRLLVETLALGRQLDEDPAPVGRVRQPAQQAGLFHSVEAVRHRAVRELHRASELPGRAAMRLVLEI